MNLNLLTPLNQLGYGIVGLNILKELVRQGHDVACFPLGRMDVSEEDKTLINPALERTSSFDREASSLRLWHQFDMAQHVGKRLHCGLPIFELNKFTSREKHHLASLDKLFVSSKWAKKVIEESEIRTETIISPFGVDRTIFNELGNKALNKTIFLNVGKWEVRKGHDILIKAFNQAFDVNDPVELWMMPTNHFLSLEQSKYWENLYKKSKLGEKIKFIDRVSTQLDVANLMKQADCGVFPSRAEGWNLELLEMMSCGKAVISTHYSGPTEFMTLENSYGVKIKELEAAYDSIWFNGQGEWAKLTQETINEISEHMKKVHELKENGKLTLNKSGIETAKEFSWKKTVEIITQHLK